MRTSATQGSGLQKQETEEVGDDGGDGAIGYWRGGQGRAQGKGLGFKCSMGSHWMLYTQE